MRRQLIACSAALASLALSGCMAVRLKDGGLHVCPVAISEEVDAVAKHAAEEDAALRTEFQAADTQLRADLTAADEKIRADAQKALDDGHAAYEAAIAAGKSAVEAERAKWEAAVQTAVNLAASAKADAEAAAKNAGDAQGAATAEATKREEAFRQVLAAIQASKLTPEAIAGLLKDPLAALTDAAKNSGGTNPVRDYGTPGAILLALLGTAAHQNKSRRKDLADFARGMPAVKPVAGPAPDPTRVG